MWVTSDNLETSDALKQQSEVRGASRGFTRKNRPTLQADGLLPITRLIEQSEKGDKTHHLVSELGARGTQVGIALFIKAELEENKRLKLIFNI